MNHLVTLFSFQREFWQETSKMKKNEYVAVLKQCGASVQVSLSKEGKCMEAHLNYMCRIFGERAKESPKVIQKDKTERLRRCSKVKVLWICL